MLRPVGIRYRLSPISESLCRASCRASSPRPFKRGRSLFIRSSWSLGKQRRRLAPSAWLCDPTECPLDATVAGEGGQLKQLLFEFEP